MKITPHVAQDVMWSKNPYNDSMIVRGHGDLFRGGNQASNERSLLYEYI